MSDVYVIYFSSTGNTEEMANCLADAIKEEGLNPVLMEAGTEDTAALKEAPVFALGCSAQGAEELDDSMESLMEAISASLEGKQVGLFGSYSWADGEWMHTWEQRVTDGGATVVTGKGVIAFEAPDDDAKSELKALGTELAKLASQV